MNAHIQQLATDVAKLKADLAGFITQVQAAIANLQNTDLTTEQQAEVDTIDQAVTAMDASLGAVTLPPAAATGTPAAS